MTGNDSTAAVIEEFERRSREFRRHWNRNFGILFLPGFLVFLAGVARNSKPLALTGFAILLVAMARGLFFVFKYRRCPVCESVQSPGMRSPYYSCRACGAQLSRGMSAP